MNTKLFRVMGFAALAGALALSACAGAATPAAVAPTPAPAAATSAPASNTGAGAGVVKIDSAQSSASFSLGEKLLGKDNTVIGKTSKVTGDITLNLANPAQSKLGTITIDASDFTTDSSQRNGAIQRFILQSNQPANQFITFEPTQITGLPAAVKVGDTLSFKVTGNLKIRAISKPATFDVTATVKSASEIAGTAKAKVTRTAYELTIPTVPSVADVTDEVALQLDFVAK